VTDYVIKLYSATVTYRVT